MSDDEEMSEEEEEEDEDEYIIPDEVELKQENTPQETPQIKSRLLYQKKYIDFLNWQKSHNLHAFDENTILRYFTDLSKQSNSASLWAKYSMLKTMINMNQNVDIDKYYKLKTFLREKHKGYKAKKAESFTPSEINRFLNEAPDGMYLSEKVALIIGVTGACRREDLHGLKMHNLRFENSILIVNIPSSRNHLARTFIVEGEYYNVIEKYMNMRPVNAPPNFLINTRNEQSRGHAIGKNKIGNMPKEIATWLGIPNPKRYTGHTFRKTAKTLLANSESSSMILKRRGEPKLFPGDVINKSVSNDRVEPDQVNSSVANQSDDSELSSPDEKPIVDQNLILLADLPIEAQGIIEGIVQQTQKQSMLDPIISPWTNLARKLGIIASKFIGANNQNIKVDLCVCGNEEKKFVRNALLLGLLTGRFERELNLINAQSVANELKVRVNEQFWRDGQNVLLVKAGGHEFKGTIVHNKCVLLSIDSTPFNDNSCFLQDHISLYRIKNSKDLIKIVSGHVAKFASINSLSISGHWVIVNTNDPETISINNIESF